MSEASALICVVIVGLAVCAALVVAGLDRLDTHRAKPAAPAPVSPFGPMLAGLIPPPPVPTDELPPIPAGCSVSGAVSEFQRMAEASYQEFLRSGRMS